MLAKDRNNNGCVLYIPEHLFTEELCYEMIKVYGFDFDLIPDHLKTDELCIEAFKYNCNAFEKYDNKTSDLCLKIVKLNPQNIKYVPDKLLTDEICMVVVNDGKFFKYIPNFFKTEEICIKAITFAASNIIYIPENLHTDKILTILLNKDLGRICDIKIKTDAVKEVAINRIKETKHYNLIQYIPNPPEDLCMQAVKSNINYLNYIQNPSEDVCMYCIEKNYELIQFIKKPSEKVCFRALEININCFRLIKNPTHSMLQYKPCENKKKDFTFSDYIEAFKKKDVFLCEFK
jgi:hypothetical protein